MAACNWPRSAAFLYRSAEKALTHAPGGAPQDGGRKVLTHAPKDALEFLGGTCLENGGVDTVGFTLGPTIGVEIERQRFARHVLRAIQGIGVPVKVFAGGGKDGQPVENRQDLVTAERRVLVPQFQITAVFLFPVLVQVQQDVDAPVQKGGVVVIEVGVEFEQTPSADLVQTTTTQCRIGNQVRNARDPFQKPQEGQRMQLVEQVAGHRSELRLIGADQLDFGLAVVV